MLRNTCDFGSGNDRTQSSTQLVSQDSDGRQSAERWTDASESALQPYISSFDRPGQRWTAGHPQLHAADSTRFLDREVQCSISPASTSMSTQIHVGGDSHIAARMQAMSAPHQQPLYALPSNRTSLPAQTILNAHTPLQLPSASHEAFWTCTCHWCREQLPRHIQRKITPR